MPKKKEPALSNPTHEVRGPDGKVYFRIRQTRNTLRIKIMFDTADYTAGEVSESWGPSGADDVMMGRWIGPLLFNYGAAVRALPVGTSCFKLGEPEASLYDYKPQVILPETIDIGQAAVAMRRAHTRYGQWSELPVIRPDMDAVRVAVVAHKAALLDGTFRRDDGPRIENPVPPEPGMSANWSRYIRGEGTPCPPELKDEFVRDCDTALAYLDFMDTIPDLPQNPRTRPATAQELRDFATYAGWSFKPEPLRAYARQVVETGIVDLIAAEAAERERIRQANIETEKRREAQAA